MFDKLINAIEPFGIGLVILAGASLAGWVNFTNKYVVGVAVFACGIMLFVSHIVKNVQHKQG